MFDLEYLGAMTPGYDINYVPESVSTNTELMASESARAGSVLIAGRQSAGRGIGFNGASIAFYPHWGYT